MTRGVTDGSTDGELLEREMSTLFAFTPDGRMLHQRDPHRSPAPRFAFAGCADGNVACVRNDVGKDIARALLALAAEEAPLAGFAASPMHRAAYVELLASERPVPRQTLGVSFVAPDHFVSDEVAPEQRVPDRDMTIIRSGTEEGARLLARLDAEGMPSELVDLGYSALWAPWCVACSGDEIVAVTETVRRGEGGVEAGVMTLPDQRRRGYASATTASWITHPELDQFTCFYSTQITNRASQSVARRLGLRFIGSTLQLD